MSLNTKSTAIQKISSCPDENLLEFQNVNVLYEKLSSTKENIDKLCEDLIINIEESSSKSLIRLQRQLEKFTKIKTKFGRTLPRGRNTKGVNETVVEEDDEYWHMVEESSNCEDFLVFCEKTEEAMTNFDLLKEDINLKRFLILSHEYLRMNKCFVDKLNKAGNESIKIKSNKIILREEFEISSNSIEEDSSYEAKTKTRSAQKTELKEANNRGIKSIRDFPKNSPNLLYSLNNFDQFNLDSKNKKFKKEDAQKMKNDYLEKQIEDNIKKSQEMMLCFSKGEESEKEIPSVPRSEISQQSLKNYNTRNSIAIRNKRLPEKEISISNINSSASEISVYNDYPKKKVELSHRKRRRGRSSSDSHNKNSNESDNGEVELPTTKKSFTYKFYSHSLIIKKYKNPKPGNYLCLESSEFTPHDLSLDPSDSLHSLENTYQDCYLQMKQILLKEEGPLDTYILNHFNQLLHIKTLYFSEFDMTMRPGKFSHEFLCKEPALNKTELFSNVKVVLCRKGKLPIHNLIKSCENLFKKFLKRKDKVGNCVIKGSLALPFDKFQTYFTQKMKSFEAVQMIQIEVYLFKWDLFQDYNFELDKTNVDKTEMKRMKTNFEILDKMRVTNRKAKILMGS